MRHGQYPTNLEILLFSIYNEAKAKATPASIATPEAVNALAPLLLVPVPCAKPLALAEADPLALVPVPVFDTSDELPETTPSGLLKPPELLVVVPVSVFVELVSVVVSKTLILV